MSVSMSAFLLFFFFNDTATTEIYTLSLHDALPISALDPRPLAEARPPERRLVGCCRDFTVLLCAMARHHGIRSEEHTSELQSQSNLVCRLLLEKKKSTSHHHEYLN